MKIRKLSKKKYLNHNKVTRDQIKYSFKDSHRLTSDNNCKEQKFS